MPQQYRVNLTPTAAQHLQEAFDFIERDSPLQAARMVQRLLDACDGLEQLPHRYKILGDTTTFGDEVRSMPLPPYLIRYHINESRKIVTVLSIRHGARRPGV